MSKKVIPYSIIFKRSSCLDSVFESTTCSDTFFNQHVEKLLSKSNLSFSEDKIIDSYMNSICCKEEANESYGNALQILETHSNQKRLDTFCKRILPYVENLSGINSYLESSNLSQDDINVIKEYNNLYNIADRVIKNHKSISRRFNIESEVSKIPFASLNSVVENCCTMIDTYKLDSYKKLNLCIEEMMYLIEKNKFKVDKSELVRAVTEYFLLTNQNLTFNDINKYKLALQENYFLEESDIDSVSFLFNPSKASNPNINDSINRFLLSPDKNEDTFIATQTMNLNKYDPIDIEYNIKRYIIFLWNNYSCGLYLKDTMINNMTDIYNKLSGNISDRTLNYSDIDSSISRETILNIINSVSVALEEIKTDGIERSKLERAEEFCNVVINHLINPLNDIKNIAYTKTNLESMDFLREFGEEKDYKDFKTFKFPNLIRASINLDKYLKNKCIEMMNNAKDKGRKILVKVNNVLCSENSNIYDFICEDNKVDITVSQYTFNESDIESVHEFLGYACKEFNNRLKIEGYDTVRSYYIINCSVAEVHIKDNTILVMNEQTKAEVDGMNDKSLNIYYDILGNTESALEKFDSFDKEPIEEALSKYDTSNLDIEHFSAIMEALKFLSVDKDDVELFAEKFSASLFMKNGETLKFVNESSSIKSTFEKWEPINNVPIEYQLEAFLALQAVMEDGLDVRKGINDAKEKVKNTADSIKGKFSKKDAKEDKDEDPKEMSEEEKKDLKKNPFKGINLNSIRVLLKGLEAKAKDVGQKEQELSKNLDSNVRRLTKAMRDALISDRREAVIKGSVIPSMSKCIKIAIALAGVYKFIDPAAAIITAIGGFAMSKHMTKKERLLLLDEIEIELDVLEKQIADAESKNQMKKYKSLLQTKKKLQREYQRIRYNVKVGKDILPNSSAGVRKFSDD